MWRVNILIARAGDEKKVIVDTPKKIMKGVEEELIAALGVDEEALDRDSRRTVIEHHNKKKEIMVRNG